LPTKALKKALQITESCVLFSRTLLQHLSFFGYKGNISNYLTFVRAT
jgi:hypothetical protein